MKDKKKKTTKTTTNSIKKIPDELLAEVEEQINTTKSIRSNPNCTYEALIQKNTPGCK